MRVQHYMVAPLIALRTDLALTAPVQLLQRYDARILDLPFPVANVAWHLYWHRSGEQDQANRWVRGEVIRLMNEMAGPPDALAASETGA